MDVDKKFKESYALGLGVFAYFKFLKLMKVNAFPYVFFIAVTGLLESAIMLALYPVIAIGLHESHPTLTRWIDFLKGMTLNEPQIIVLHLAAFLLFGVFCSMSKWGAEAGLEVIRAKLEQESRRYLAEALQKTSWLTYVRLGSGKSLHLLATSAKQISDGCVDFVFQLGLSLAAAVSLIALAIISPLLFLAIIALFTAGEMLQKNLAKTSLANSQSYGAESEGLSSGYQFIIQNLKYCRSSGFANELSAAINIKAGKSIGYIYKTQKAFARQRVLLDLSAFLAIAMVLFSALVFRSITFGVAAIFLAMLYRLIPKVAMAKVCFQKSLATVPFLQLWYSTYQSAKESPELDEGTIEVAFSDTIRFNDVSFRYGPNLKNILTNLNIEIKKNAFIALIGESGSGKSTALDLLTGLLKPTTGTILIDEINLDAVAMTFWHKQFGLVLQDTPIMKGTVLENIAFSTLDPDIEWATECAKSANALDFINRMPQKMHTLIDEKLSISGGEAQRLALARALYGRPNILILDEPTSALDAQNEERFINSILKLSGNITVIIATHRMSIIEHATDVLLFKKDEPTKFVKKRDFSVSANRIIA